MELKKIGLVVVILVTSGCGQNEDVNALMNMATALNTAVTNQSATIKKLTVDDDARIAKAISSNSRLSSIAAYLMQEQDAIGLTEDVKAKVLYASEQIQKDQLSQLMYKSLLANGLPLFYKVIHDDGHTKTYSVRDKWVLETQASSAFYNTYPSQALELIPYERVTYTNNVCQEGFTPIVIHSLLKRDEQVPNTEVVVQEQSKGWQVFLPNEDFYNALKNYRVLLDVRCQPEQ